MPHLRDKGFLVHPLHFRLFPWEEMKCYLQNSGEIEDAQRFRRSVYENEIPIANMMHAMLANGLKHVPTSLCQPRMRRREFWSKPVRRYRRS